MTCPIEPTFTHSDALSHAEPEHKSSATQSASVASVALLGVSTFTVEVEVDLSPGMMTFSTVGLPAGAVVEARTRVKSALQNSGHRFPQKRVVVNLAPAHLRKIGTAYDLPIAVGLLVAQGALPTSAVEGTLIIGELALDGRIRPIRGALPMALHGRRAGFRRILAPRENAEEIAAVGGLDYLPAGTLTEAIGLLDGSLSPELPRSSVRSVASLPDLADVRGQRQARRALEIAAAGGHNLLLIGPPGVGKTMLARRLSSISAPMTELERLEAAAVASVSGHTSPESALAGIRPFRAPHHSASHVALVGGGSPPRPGEVSLAHHGVLFLDELPEFSRRALEALRQPLEDREVVISRATGALRWPASFALMAAMNPCPCGYLGHPRRACEDPPHRVQAYRAKISGPLLDRIDLHVAMDSPDARLDDEPSTPSAVVADRVAEAVARQRHRGSRNNALTVADLHRLCPLDDEGRRFMASAFSALGLSPRAHDRVIRLARTVADLAGAPEIKPIHLAEAMQYRQLDRSDAGIR